MMYKALFGSLFLLSSTFSALGHVLPTSRHVEISKRNVNLNLHDFEDLEFPGYSQQQLEDIFRTDMDGAIALAFSATQVLSQTGVESTPEFIRWFGPGATAAHVAPILHGYQNIVDLYSPSNTRTLDVFASNANANTQGGDVQAFVTTAQPQGMSIFRAYWSVPPSSAVVPPQPGTGTGAITTLESRAAVLIHELFHYTFVIPFSTGQSNDPRYAERYGQDACLALAISDPSVAVINPENLMYYALDVTYGWTRNQKTQPPPPPPKSKPLPKPPPGSDSNDPLASFKAPGGASVWWYIIHGGSNDKPWRDQNL